MKKIFFSILFVMSFITFYGQDNNKIALSVIIPPTPEAAALGKYGSYPVDMCVGIPEIKIPIYTVKCGKLELPIALSYHASGIKVDEIATWVGLGWTLHAGGSVSRSILGLPDESNFGFLNNTCLKSPQVFSQFRTYGMNYYEDGKRYFDQLENNLHDSQSDQYSFNVNGISGSFMYDIDKNLFQRPYSDHRIIRTSNNNFEIIGDDGVQYKFFAKETSKINISNYIYTAPITWLLTDVISPDKADTITLTYKSSGEYEEYFSSATACIGDRPSSCSTSYPALSYGGSKVSYNEQVLESIEFRGGKVLFSTSNTFRKDKRNLNLENIQVVNKLGQVIKDIDFEYGHFISGAGNSKFNNRLKLLAIHEQADSKRKSHRFTYNQQTLPPYFDPNNSSDYYFGQDHWGYYNGVVTNKSLLSVIPPGYPNWNPANRNSSQSFMQASSLNRIDYPTGGFTTFTYEANRIVTPLGKEEATGGLRVIKIVSKPSSNETEIATTYAYGENESGIGTMITPLTPSVYSYQKYYTCLPIGTLDRSAVLSFCSENPLTPMGYHSGSPVFYPIVTAYQGTKSVNSGRTVTEYMFVNNPTCSGTAPVKSYLGKKYEVYGDNVPWMRGQIKKESYFEKDQTVAKKEISYDYTDIMNYRSYCVGKLVNCHWIYNSSVTTGGPYTDARDYYEYIYLSAWSGLVKCTKKTELTRQESNGSSPAIKDVTYYEYGASAISDNRHYHLTKQTRETSDNQLYHEVYKYPKDLLTGLSSEALTGKNSLILNNQTNIVLEKSQYKNNTLLYTTRTNYSKNWPANPYLVAPFSIEAKKGQELSETRLLYGNYDSRGNPLYITKDNADKIVYLWGYNYQYPIAKIENTSYSEITAKISQATLDGIAISDIPSDFHLTLMNNLRTALPNSLITTYTYKPLVGVTSVTDPRGVKTTYEYNDSGQLKQIKDMNGKIIESYDYHYKNQ